MGTFERIYRNLYDLLKTIDSFQDKHIAPTFKFNGFPAFFIAPSGNEADFLTTNDNQRIYAFKVWVFTEYDETAPDSSYLTLAGCVDDVINKCDQQESPEAQSRQMANELGDGITLLAVMASPSRFALDEEEKLLGSEITVRAKVSVDLTLLT